MINNKITFGGGIVTLTNKIDKINPKDYALIKKYAKVVNADLALNDVFYRSNNNGLYRTTISKDNKISKVILEVDSKKDKISKFSRIV